MFYSSAERIKAETRYPPPRLCINTIMTSNAVKFIIITAHVQQMMTTDDSYYIISVEISVSFNR